MELCRSSFSLGDDFLFVSVFSAMFGSTANTCTASVYGVFGRSPYSAPRSVQQWIQVHASDYGGWVFASDLTPRAVLFFPLVRPMMRCIMAGIFLKDICPRLSSSSLSWCGGRSPWSSDHGDYTVAVRQGFFVPVCWLCSSTGAGCGGDSRDPSVASCSSPSCR